MSKYEIGGELTADRTEDPTFIHSRVDDLGLSMAEFRVYCHLKRRANLEGVSWPGIDSMAHVCRAHRETVLDAIAGLEERKMLLVTRQKGKRNRYRLTKPSLWKDQSEIVNGNQSEMVNAPVGNSERLPVDNGERHQSEMVNVRVSTQGNPVEGNPIKDTPIPPRGIVVKFEQEFVQFWNQLPEDNRIAPGKTKEAWNKQVHKGSTPEEILAGVEKLVKYEKLRKQKDPNGYQALHPTTWLNQERWNDGAELEQI